MTTHILVATDGSDTAIKTVDMAADLAAKLDVPLTIGHALQFDRNAEELARMADVEHMVGQGRTRSGIDLPNVPDNMVSLFRDTRPGDDTVRLVTLIGEEILDRAAKRAKDYGAKTVQTRSENGDPSDTILDMAEAIGADMIVVGHRGLGRLKTALLGSVAHKVVQHAPCTVVSVR